VGEINNTIVVGSRYHTGMAMTILGKVRVEVTWYVVTPGGG
jgi:hypothetical protein